MLPVWPVHVSRALTHSSCTTGLCLRHTDPYTLYNLFLFQAHIPIHHVQLVYVSGARTHIACTTWMCLSMSSTAPWLSMALYLCSLLTGINTYVVSCYMQIS